MHHMVERVESDDGTSQTTSTLSIGILGGTGALGRGLARRLAPVVGAVLVGSRSIDRATEAATAIGHGVVGATNEAACATDVVVVAVPWSSHDSFLADLAPHLVGRIVIDAVNPLGFDARGPYPLGVAAGSAAERAQELLPGNAVVGAFHHVAAGKLESMADLDTDVMVVGDSRNAVSVVCALIDAVPGLRAVYSGRLRNAGPVEALTANLIAINRRYGTEAGIRITGVG
jgi:NADPH-dependent F420 reductase